MNPKRRILVLLVLSGLASSLGAQTVIDQLYGLHRYELADAYWAAGQKFVDLGQADRGAEFKAAALRIFPGYVPGQVPSVQVSQTAPPEVPRVPDAAQVREKNLQGEKIARLQFQKLLRGYLTGNSATIASVLASQIVVQGQSVSPTAGSVSAFLEAHPATAGSPDELFAPGSMEALTGTGDTVLVTVEALGDLPELPFWTTHQVYTFDRVGDTWKLVAVEGLSR